MNRDRLTGVYQIRNLVNGKVYVGSAGVSIKKRWKDHVRDANNKKHHSISFQRAWDKYGQDNFAFEVLARCPKEYCIKLEQWFLDRLKPEYNISPTAGTRKGIKLPEEELKIRLANRKKPNYDEEYRRKVSEAAKKYFSCPEARKRQSEKAKKRLESKEYRDRLIGQLEKHRESTTAEQRSEIAKKAWQNKEYAERQKSAKREWLDRPETRKMIGANTIRVFASQEIRDRVSQKNSKVRYEIMTPTGEIDHVSSLNRYTKERGLIATFLNYTLVGHNPKGVKFNAHKGYKMISKTPIK